MAARRAAVRKSSDHDDGRSPITLGLSDGARCAHRSDNNWVENQIRPIAIGRSNWLFAGSLRAGKLAAAIMSRIHSARLNGHDPCASLHDVMQRVPTQPVSRIGELLTNCWSATPTM